MLMLILRGFHKIQK